MQIDFEVVEIEIVQVPATPGTPPTTATTEVHCLLKGQKDGQRADRIVMLTSDQKALIEAKKNGATIWLRFQLAGVPGAQSLINPQIILTSKLGG